MKTVKYHNTIYAFMLCVIILLSLIGILKQFPAPHRAKMERFTEQLTATQRKICEMTETDEDGVRHYKGCPRKLKPLEHRGPILFTPIPKPPTDRCLDVVETIFDEEHNISIQDIDSYQTLLNTDCASVLGKDIGIASSINDCYDMIDYTTPFFAYQNGKCYATTSTGIQVDPAKHVKSDSACEIMVKPKLDDYTISILN